MYDQHCATSIVLQGSGRGERSEWVCIRDFDTEMLQRAARSMRLVPLAIVTMLSRVAAHLEA